MPSTRREASLRKFLSLPERFVSKKAGLAQAGQVNADERPLGASRARRMLLFENAAVLGDIEWLQALLEAGVDVNGANVFGQTALFLASWYGQADAVAMLLFHGAEQLPASGGATPLEAAASKQHQKVVDVLHASGCTKTADACAQPAVSYRVSADVDLVPKLLLPETGMVGSWLLPTSFQDDFLGMLDGVGNSLPVPETEMGRRAAERLFFCDAVGCVSKAVTSLLRDTGFDEVYVSPWLRFLRYKSPNVPLVPHVDYEWLPGYISAALPGYAPADRRTTHTLLLYLTDCHDGGETWLLDGTPDEVSDPPTALARVPARRGCIFLFPHKRLHMGTALSRLPKMMLRADVRLGAAPVPMHPVEAKAAPIASSHVQSQKSRPQGVLQAEAVEDAAKLREDQQRLQAWLPPFRSQPWISSSC